jgi:two-component system, chemotaxis family, protein-glutamate methylesterase/glutaminase
MISNATLIVIGASAGGVETLSQLVRELPAELPAAIGIVIHFPSYSTSVLPSILARAGQLPAVHASDHLLIKPGTIYIAPPNQHLWVEDGLWRLSQGARENGHRPAIDPLFRTAGRVYKSHAIGVILSGTLDDGSTGLEILKQQGGIAIVQDQTDAIYGDMPRNAIEATRVDYILPVSEMAAKLVEVVAGLAGQSQVGGNAMTGEANDLEGNIVRQDKVALEHGERPGQTTMFTCPDCGGVMWELQEGDSLRFRCHVGHAYSAESFLAEKGDSFESALWSAYRALEEKASLARRMAERARKRKSFLLEERYVENARNAEAQAAAVREVLTMENNVVQSETSNESVQ